MPPSSLCRLLVICDDNDENDNDEYDDNYYADDEYLSLIRGAPPN